MSNVVTFFLLFYYLQRHEKRFCQSLSSLFHFIYFSFVVVSIGLSKKRAQAVLKRKISYKNI